MPFKHALVDDPYYKEIVKGNFDNYWAKLESKVPTTSKDFKTLYKTKACLWSESYQ